MSKSSYISFIPAHFDDWHPYFKKNNIDEKFNSKVFLFLNYKKLPASSSPFGLE